MSDDQVQPTSPLTELAAGAVQMHEWFTSLVEAGFTDAQAIALMAACLRPEATS